VACGWAVCRAFGIALIRSVFDFQRISLNTSSKYPIIKISDSRVTSHWGHSVSAFLRNYAASFVVLVPSSRYVWLPRNASRLWSAMFKKKKFEVTQSSAILMW
jgi:hypothetical protein